MFRLFTRWIGQSPRTRMSFLLAPGGKYRGSYEGHWDLCGGATSQLRHLSDYCTALVRPIRRTHPVTGYQAVPNPPERITGRNEPGVRVVDMTVIGIILGSLFGILAVLLVVTGVLAWKAKLPGNPVLGIRVPEVRKSQELWDMAHRVAGPLWVLSGVAWAIASLMAFAATGWMWLVVGLAVIGGLVFLGMGAGMGAHTVAMVDAKRKAEGADSGGCSSCGEGGCGSAAEGTTSTCAPADEPVENDTPLNAPAIDFDALRRAAQAQTQASQD